MAIDRERVLAAAQKYVERKRYDRAITEYEKVIQEDPSDARTLLKIGDLYSKIDNYAEAVATYERVGRYYSSHGFSLKAIAVYKQIRDIVGRHALELGERYAHIVPKLAELYQQLGLTSDAIAALEEVAARCQQTGRDAEAVDVFKRIVAFDPSNPIPHIRLAEGLSRLKDVDGAVAEFAVAAGQLVRQGRRDDALKVFERLLHHKPDPTHARIAADLYLARNGPNDGLQALAKLQMCFQSNPRDLDTLGLLAKAFTQIGQTAKAIEVQKELARLARETGKLELFEEVVARLRKLVPNDDEVLKLAGVEARVEPPAPARVPSVVPSIAPSGAPSVAPRPDADVVDFDARALALSPPGPQAPSSEETLADADVEEIEEAPEPAAVDAIADVLTEADSFRRAKLFRKAADVLRTGIRTAPQSLPLHEALRDVLLDAQRTGEAVAEILVLAGLLGDRGDIDAAVRSIQDALAYEPKSAKALEMLHALGYELASETAVVDAPAHQASSDSFGPLQAREPEPALPSYPIDDAQVGTPLLASGARQGSAVGASELSEIDAPFGDDPLPAFPVSEHELPPLAEVLDTPFDEPPPEALRPSTQAASRDLESALDEAEFFASRGLYEDARGILREQLARHPNHPLLRERMAEVDAAQGAEPGESGTRRKPRTSSHVDHSFSIAASLGAADAGDRVSGLGPGPGALPSDQTVDVEEVFAKFKEGVAKQIGFDDAQSHYDLGVAYKEMGLFDDAIREFETASLDTHRACVCQSMIGMIHLERGNLNAGIDAFVRGLESPERTREQEAALCYEIGAAYEVKKMSSRALEYFGETARLVPNFRDVHERIRKLQAAESKRPPRAAAVGADDEFDRAFQDILTSSKAP
ncbi:MAG: tetratricopeptide repeat protein [Polyangiaceae bacterium]